jgi:hypothetical protein
MASPSFSPYNITAPTDLSSLAGNATYIVLGGPTCGKDTLVQTLQTIASSNGSTVLEIDPTDSESGVILGLLTVTITAYGAGAAALIGAIVADPSMQSVSAVTTASATQSSVTVTASNQNFWTVPLRDMGAHYWFCGPLTGDMVTSLWENVVNCDAAYWPQGVQAFEATYFSEAGYLSGTYNWLLIDCSDPSVQPPPCNLYFNAPGQAAGDTS